MRVATRASTVSGICSAASRASFRRRELLEEQRVAGAALHERGQLLVRQAPVARRRAHERPRVVRGKRLEPQRESRERRRALGGREAAFDGSPGRAREPRPRRELRAEVAQQLGRRVVHPVDVLEHEQRRRVEQLAEQRAHDAVESRAPERGIEVVHLRRRLDVDVERRREERRPGNELLVDRTSRRSASAVRLCSPPPFSSTSRSERRNGRNGVVRSRRLVLLAAQRDLPHVGAVLAQLLREPRLPDAGLADELDERAEAHPDRRDRRSEDGALALAVDEGQLVVRRGPPRVALSGASSPSTTACTGSLFPFTWKGSSSVASNGAPPRANASAETQISSSPARAISRAASAAVSPSTVYVLPEARADLTGEDASLAHADVHGERKSGVDDGTDGPEHPLLVVAERLRCARDQDDPPAVAVDVALEERHAMGRRRLPGRCARARRARRRRPRALRCAITSSVPAKRTNAIAAFRCSPSNGPTSRSCARSGAGTATSSGIPSTLGKRLHRAPDLGRCAEEQPTPVLVLADRVRLRGARPSPG